MTTFRDRRAAAWFKELDSNEVIECASTRGWTVIVKLGTKLDQLRQRLPSVVAECDLHRVDNPARMPAARWSKDVRWFVSAGIGLYPSSATRPGTVRIQMPPTSGFPSEEGLNRDLKHLLSDPGIATKLSKLSDHSDVTERHLAVGACDVYRPGLDLVAHLLFSPDHVPLHVLPDEFAASHVWITGGSHSVLTWTRSSGWSWQSLPRH
ncbi:hypothetical protein MYCSP_14015 [Mycobacteroides saopaulense]|uniref:hypothetical protein n=1 Tax=Mycobacteroides saopaulense TaxID=1578165 RepID=UPI0007216CA9|nr:hypothetical protein [Mycobacteroides saopaulense]ALR12340.1 hypothetical protein MYCSP_14015 [Mycobacteroides saopaulense]